MIIVFEKIEPVVEKGEVAGPINPILWEFFRKHHLTGDEALKLLKSKLKIKVDKMHNLGYAHGNLDEEVLYFKIVDDELEIFISDFEYVFPIATSRNNPKVRELVFEDDLPSVTLEKLPEGITFDELYDMVVEYDYDQAIEIIRWNYLNDFSLLG